MIIGATLGRYFSKRFAKTILGGLRDGLHSRLYARFRRADASRRRFSRCLRCDDGPACPLRTPSVAEQVLPFAVLFGSMATLLQLSRKLELVVARAA